jgi:spore coat polysaccharide biosynthesis protein SpsF
MSAAARTLCVVQARTGSTRLPGKVLAPVGGVPMLEFMLARLDSLAVDDLVVATSVYERDDPVAQIAARMGIDAVRGPEQDVLARFGVALDAHPAQTVVRLTADCPLTDPRLVESVVVRHHERGAAYTTNVMPRTFPKGLDVEVVAADALRYAIEEAGDPVEREHVTPFVYRRPERFRLANVRSGMRLGAQRWTVDTAADLEWVRHAVARVGDPQASWQEILAVVGTRHDCAAPCGLALRPAEGADAGRLLAWRNETEAVRQSASGRAVDSVEHARWFAGAIDDPAHRIWIGELDGRPIGMVRVDVQSAVGTVSILVDAQARGRGVGTALLRALNETLCGDCQIKTLVAHVRPANSASLKAFGANGYESLGSAPDGLVRLVQRPLEKRPVEKR